MLILRTTDKQTNKETDASRTHFFFGGGYSIIIFMSFDSGNYLGQDPYIEGDSCTACHRQTFGKPLNPGYKCVDELCGKFASLLTKNCVL